MAGAPRNQEQGVQGADIILDAFFREQAGGALVDPDSVPTFDIYDPANTLVFSGTSVKQSVGVYHATYAIPMAATISNMWKIIWTASIAGKPVADAEEFFIVLAPGSIGFGTDLPIIEEKWMRQIKKVLAFPQVETILLSDDEIKDLCVTHALHDYFKKFPIEKKEQFQITRNLDLDFPTVINFPATTDNKTVYGVKEARIVNKFGNRSSSSFWDIVRHQTLYSRTYGQIGSYKTPYNYEGQQQSLWAQRQALDTFTNDQTFNYRVNKEEKKLETFSSISGDLVVTWAAFSSNFADVKYSRQFEVVQLAQAYLLWHLADTTSIVEDNSLDQSVQSAELKARAEALYTEVMEKWNEEPDVVVMRMT